MTLPPYAALLGLTVEQADDGTPGLAMPWRDSLVGRPGFLHGGAIGGLLEMAAIVALRHALGEDGAIKPIGVTVDYMRGGRDHMTRARGFVTRLGGRIANVDAVAWQESPDKPIARARMNYLIVRPGS